MAPSNPSYFGDPSAPLSLRTKTKAIAHDSPPSKERKRARHKRNTSGSSLDLEKLIAVLDLPQAAQPNTDIWNLTEDNFATAEAGFTFLQEKHPWDKDK